MFLKYCSNEKNVLLLVLSTAASQYLKGPGGDMTGRASELVKAFLAR